MLVVPVSKRWALKPQVLVFALAGTLGAGAIVYYLAAERAMVFGNIGRRPLGWAFGIMSFLVPMTFPRWISPLACMGVMLLGVAVAGTSYVFITGPGNLWPIAMAFIVSFAVIPVGAGALVAFMLRLAVQAFQAGGSVDGH